MGIMTRFTRVFKADIHGVMDQLENKELMLKQCVREMEDTLIKNQNRHKRLKIILDQLTTEIRQFNQERDKLEQDIGIAVLKEKDDIARLLIKKRIKIDEQIHTATRQTESIESQLQKLSETIDQQKCQYEQMQLRSESWLQKSEHQKWEESASVMMNWNDWHSITDEEVELELIKIKDSGNTFKGDA